MPGAPPYVPFKTFLSAIEGFERGLPRQLDRSLWPSYSGAIQGQLLAAFRYLSLLDEAHAPTAALRDLVANPGQRRPLLRAMLEKHYPDLIALELDRASPRQLDEAMRHYGLNGVTHKKAMWFFLQAAGWAGLPLSPLLKGRTRAAAAPAPRRAEPAPPKSAVPAPPGLAKSVQLKNGGTVTITAHVDLFSLDADDRAFLFALIDRLREYEGGT